MTHANEKETKARLKIWDAVKETDPARTKQYQGPGGFTGTSIVPTYLLHKATALWGPIGHRWGYKIISEHNIDGAPILGPDDNVLGHQVMNKINIEFRYPAKLDTEAIIPHYGCTPFIYQNKYGIQTDFDAPKKSLTDAISKCLYMLGFGADIMLGDFEDPDYRQTVSEKVRIETATDKIKESEDIKAEHRQWFDNHLKLLQTSVNPGELQTLVNIMIKTLSLRNDADGMKTVKEAAEIRKSELTKPKPETKK